MTKKVKVFNLNVLAITTSEFSGVQEPTCQSYPFGHFADAHNEMVKQFHNIADDAEKTCDKDVFVAELEDSKANCTTEDATYEWHISEHDVEVEI